MSSEQNTILSIGDKGKDQEKANKESGKMQSSHLWYFIANQWLIPNNTTWRHKDVIETFGFLDLHSLQSAKIKDNYLFGIFSEKTTSILETFHQGIKLCCSSLYDACQSIISLSRNKPRANQYYICRSQILPGKKLSLSSLWFFPLLHKP